MYLRRLLPYTTIVRCDLALLVFWECRISRQIDIGDGIGSFSGLKQL